MSEMGWAASISEEFGVGEYGAEVRRVGAGDKLSPSIISEKGSGIHEKRRLTDKPGSSSPSVLESGPRHGFNYNTRWIGVHSRGVQRNASSRSISSSCEGLQQL